MKAWVKKILLVEDDPVTALTQKYMLENYGYSVTIATSGRAAIETFTSSPEIDCILMDIDLGDDIDGTAAAKIILEKKDLPVIFLSSHTEPEIVEKTETITSYGYVVNNTGITVLDTCIKMASKLYKARRSLQDKNNELVASNEELRVAIEELEAANEQLIESENIILSREKLLHESEQRYRSLFECMQEGFYHAELVYDKSGTPVDWRFLNVNPAHSKILGLEKEDVIGHTVYELFPSLEKEWFDITVNVALTGKPAKMEGFVEATGRYYENNYYSPCPGQFASVFTDITERVSGEIHLRKSEERYRTLVEQLPIGIFKFDLSDPDKLVDANPALARLNNENTIDNIMSVPISSFFVNTEEMAMLIDFLKEHGSITDKLIHLKRTDGQLWWGSTTAVCHFNKAGEPVWIQGIIEDVTDKIELEEKLNKHHIFLETLIDTMVSPVFYKDSSGFFIGCNNIFAELIIGLPRQKIINKSILELTGTIPAETAQQYILKDNELFDNPGRQIYEAQVKCSDGEIRYFHFNNSTFSDADGNVAGIVGIMVDITELKTKENQLTRINEEYNILIASMSSILIGVSTKDRITHWNPLAEKVFGNKASDMINKNLLDCNLSWNWVTIYEGISNSILEDRIIHLEDVSFIRPDGKPGIIGLTINPLKRGQDILAGFLIIGKELTEQRMMEQQLLQSSKLEAIGQLAAGVAHEINTPMQYIGDNLQFINRSMVVLLNMLDIYQRITERHKEILPASSHISQIEELSAKENFSFILEELPSSIEQSLEGVKKISKIVQSMKAFSHPGTGRKIPADINTSLENTISVSRNAWKYSSDIQLKLDKTLPDVPCYESELNQVFLNLIINAIDAINDHKNRGFIEKGLIIICTFKENNYAVITISDNGGGIPENIQKRVFDPFFTTKGVGKGTGQGLAISFSIIHDKHNGSLFFESVNGEGTTFFIKLPLKDE